MQQQRHRAIRVISWNVDGLRQEHVEWLLANEPRADLVFLSETRADEKRVRSLLAPLLAAMSTAAPAALYVSTTRGRLHGVALAVRGDLPHRPLRVELKGCGPRVDVGTKATATDGRLLAVDLLPRAPAPSSSSTAAAAAAAAVTEAAPLLRLVGTYVPNAGRGLKHLVYRTREWDPALRAALEALRGGGGDDDGGAAVPVVWLGDLNVVPDPALDTWPPAATAGTPLPPLAGLTSEERANFSALLRDGWVDGWRHLHPCRSPPEAEAEAEAAGCTQVTSLDSGGTLRLRLDGAVLSPEAVPLLKQMAVLDRQQPPHPAEAALSDHLPLAVTLQVSS